MSLASIYTTAPTLEDAKKISKALVESRVAACVNILGPATALYWWKGELKETEEIPMMIKTQMRLVKSCIAVIRENHPFEVPAITATPVLKADPDFVKWVITETEQEEA